MTMAIPAITRAVPSAKRQGVISSFTSTTDDAIPTRVHTQHAEGAGDPEGRARATETAAQVPAGPARAPL